METAVFIVCAVIVLAGALGVVLARNPVHAALSLVGTLFGMAVLFLNLEAHFLAAVQIIVYAGAIVVLFLFVIMLLGVDRLEDLSVEPITGQRTLAILAGVGTFVLAVAFLLGSGIGPSDPGPKILTLDITDQSTYSNLRQIADFLFTDYVYAFEATAALLTISVVGAVVMSRRMACSDEAQESAGDD